MKDGALSICGNQLEVRWPEFQAKDFTLLSRDFNPEFSGVPLITSVFAWPHRSGEEGLRPFWLEG